MFFKKIVLTIENPFWKIPFNQLLIMHSHDYDFRIKLRNFYVNTIYFKKFSNKNYQYFKNIYLAFKEIMNKKKSAIAFISMKTFAATVSMYVLGFIG